MDLKFFKLVSHWIPTTGFVLLALTLALLAGPDRPVQSARAQESPAAQTPVTPTRQDPATRPENKLALTADYTLSVDTVSKPAELDRPRFHRFRATAYCLKGITSSGVRVRSGIIAADPTVLPIGSVVKLKAGTLSGIYTVLDTGANVKGNQIDIYLPTLKQCREFGVRRIGLEVLRKGWDPDSIGENAKP